MKRVFINYRRDDSYDLARRLAGTLTGEFGRESVFFDRESTEPGTAWPKRIREKVEAADAFLAIIGKRWLYLQDENSGRRRIDMEDDWVRREIVTFLDKKKEKNKLLFVPVILDGTNMPRRDHLDSVLQQVCDHQAIQINNTGATSDFLPIRQLLVDSRFQPITPPVVVTPLVGLAPVQLEETDETEFLKSHKCWQITEREKPGVPGETVRELYRVYEFSSYKGAWRFMTLVNENCIRRLNHHPRWQNTYNRVEFWLCTFNIGHKPSKKDIRFAELLEATWEQAKQDG